jgi:GTPase SAR1 family protein
MGKKADERLKLLLERVKTRFLRPEMQTREIKTLKEILELPVFNLKNVDKMSALAIKKIFQVTTIGELAKLNPKDPFASLVPADIIDPKEFAKKKAKVIEQAMGDFTEESFNLARAIIIAQMIARAWEKRSAYLDEGKKETKILVLGLDNAGKTAILSGLGGKMGLGDLRKLKPTKGVERKKISAKNLNIYIWDLGGQIDYRTNYLENPEMFFLETNMLMYVIDMQDPDRFNESMDYFKKILDILRSFGETPYVLIFLHKSDPDLIGDPDYQLNLEYIREQLLNVMQREGEKSDFEFDMFQTSIFNFSTEPEFSKMVKDMMATKSLNDPVIEKVQGFGEILDHLMNTMLSLAANLNEQVAAINARISTMEVYLQQKLQPNATQGQFTPASVQTPPPLESNIVRPPPAPGTVAAARQSAAPQVTVRQAIMDELRVLFAKRREMSD